MTRKEYYEMLANRCHVDYDDYAEQAKSHGAMPISFEAWLETDDSTHPGYAEAPHAKQNKPRDAKGRFVPSADEEPSPQPSQPGQDSQRATPKEALEALRHLEKLLSEVERIRGKAPKAPDPTFSVDPESSCHPDCNSCPHYRRCHSNAAISSNTEFEHDYDWVVRGYPVHFSRRPFFPDVIATPLDRIIHDMFMI